MSSAHPISRFPVPAVADLPEDLRQRIIITVGVPLGSPGSTNMLRIAQVGKKKTPAA